MWSFCLFLTLVAASHQLSIDEFLVPLSVEEGSSVELKCEYSLGIQDTSAPYIKWWFTPLGDDAKPHLMYQRIRKSDGLHDDLYLHPGFERSGPNDNIVLKTARADDSGKYVCEVSSIDDEKRVGGVLVVYSNGTGPQLNISLVSDGPDADDDQDLLVECTARDVTPQPELGIYANGRPLQDIAQYVWPIVDDTSIQGRYIVKANVTISTKDLDEVRCELFYVNHNISHLPFVDTVNYSSGAETTETATVLDTTNHTDPAPQTNRSTSSSVSWLLSMIAVLVAVSQSIQTSS